MACDTEFKPDHIIIWCDRNMGKEENNKASKAILDENADVNRSESSEYCREIDDFICSINPYLNKDKYGNLIRCPLRMFTDERKCIRCVRESIQANKRVFLITSGQTGAVIIPDVFEQSELRKKLSGSTYIFCAQRTLHENWTGPYEKDIEIYDDEKGVFAKVLLDIGVYYLTKGQNETENRASATQYFYWAKRLIKSATKVDGIKRDDYIACILEELSGLNAAPSDGYDTDVQMGVAPD